MRGNWRNVGTRWNAGFSKMFSNGRPGQGDLKRFILRWALQNGSGKEENSLTS